MKTFRLETSSGSSDIWPRTSSTSRLLCVLLSVGVALSGVLVACGGDSGDEKDGGGAAGDGDSSGDGDIDLNPGDGDFSGDGDTAGLGLDGSCNGLGVGEGCAGEVYEGEAVPLDLYLMFDQSGSMATVVDEASGTTRMDIVRTAVEAFLQDDESVGMGAGIGYFGHQPLGETTCNVDEYSSPDVEIGTLPGSEEALLDSLATRAPTGETPTGSAIRGACEYVAAYNETHAVRNPSILLVTDGEPKAPLSEEVCAPTLDDAVAAAEECYEQSGIRVYVLGVGPSLTNLRVIAEAGGTEDAFLADLDNAQQVLDAFRAVRYAAQLPCALSLGDQAMETNVSLDGSTVAYLDFECGYHAVPGVADAGACGGEAGWYFDDPEEPTTIHLCDVTCDDVKSTGRQLFYSLGCPLQVVR